MSRSVAALGPGNCGWMTEIPFLTVIPRAAAQVSAAAGSGTVLSTGALSSIATASLGAMVAADERRSRGSGAVRVVAPNH